jgi:hypothetical protein
VLFICYFRYNRFENNREASLQTAKAPAAQVETGAQKLTVEAGGDALIDLSEEAAPSVGSKGSSAVPNLNTKFAGLSTSPCLSGRLFRRNAWKKYDQYLNENFVRFEVFTAMTMKNGILQDVTQCGSCKNRRFGGT